IFKPTPTQNFRATYNRAFSTPANFSYFLDLISSRNLGGLPYNVRAIGNPPKVGWQFARNCDASVFGGLCMKSFLLPNSNQFVPASGAIALPGLIAANAQAIQAALVPSFQAFGLPAAQAQALAAQVAGFLGTLRPTPSDISSHVHYILPGSHDLA